MDYGTPSTIELELQSDNVLAVRLDRPDVHNAFNETVVAELDAVFRAASDDAAVRAVLLSGNGKSFSAGADIQWMRDQGGAGFDQNRASAMRMARMFEAIHSCAKPVVARVHGAALGGGTGLTAAADIAVAARSATFGFTEVRLGILPAVIAPYVIEKLGLAKARALFLLGSRFDGAEAERVGLVFRSCADVDLDREVEGCLAALARGGPNALREAKTMVQGFAPRSAASMLGETSALIARMRSGDEAKEGLTAFLDKRLPTWCTK